MEFIRQRALKTFGVVIFTLFFLSCDFNSFREFDERRIATSRVQLLFVGEK